LSLIYKVGFMTQSMQQPKELELLKQLIGDWSVGIALKTGDDNVVSGCGEMSAVEIADIGINSEIDTQIEGYEDYYENDLWSYDRATGKVHLFGITSEGQAHDHVGNWTDQNTLELYWRGTFEDQELEEKITAKWITKDQIELKEVNLSLGKVKFTTNYVFKRKKG
jgi:hypothetical protein